MQRRSESTDTPPEGKTNNAEVYLFLISPLAELADTWPWEYEAVVDNLVDRQARHSRRPVDFPDVYAQLASRPCDAILDVFLALPPVPAELHALRLHLACSGRLF